MRSSSLWILAALAASAVAAAPNPQVATEHAPQQYSHQPSGGLTVLYDQTANDGGVGLVSQNFEPSFDAFDSQAADDFVVTASQGWTIQQLFVPGVYFNGAGPVNSVNVWFYQNSAGGGNPDLPGAAVCTYSNVVPTTDNAGTLTIDLPTACILTPATYWVSVQANMDFATGGEWGWEDDSVQATSSAAWQNPGGGFGVGCTSWGVMQTCLGFGPDLLFQVLGTVGGGQPALAIPALGKVGLGLLLLALAGAGVVALRGRAA